MSYSCLQLTPSTRVVTVEISAFNPSLAFFCALRVSTVFAVDGGVKHAVAAFVFPLFTDRFQPSVRAMIGYPALRIKPLGCGLCRFTKNYF